MSGDEDGNGTGAGTGQTEAQRRALVDHLRQIDPTDTDAQRWLDPAPHRVAGQADEQAAGRTTAPAWVPAVTIVVVGVLCLGFAWALITLSPGLAAVLASPVVLIGLALMASRGRER